MAVDLIPCEKRAREKGYPYFPLKQLREMLAGEGVDIIETLVTLQERVPFDDSPEEIAKNHTDRESKKFALQMSGARIIDCPAKRSPSSPSGFKQSDDQRLMLTTLTLALKLKPDFVLLFAADGDFAPMVEMLRAEGIRTEVVAAHDMLASELKCQAANIIDYDSLLDAIPH